MTAFDYVLLFLLAGFMLISMTKGLVREVISLVSWVVAFYVATHYGDILIPWLPNAVSGDVMRMIVAFIVLFIGTPGCHGNTGKTGQCRIACNGVDVTGPFSGRVVRACKRGAGRSGTRSGLRDDENTRAAVLEECDVQPDGGTGRENDHAVFAWIILWNHIHF